MTKRLIPTNINDTTILLGEILTETLTNRIMFLTAPGEARNVIQRCRVMLSRVRKRLKQDGRRRKHFTLNHTIHPHTEHGKRYDCLVVWRSTHIVHSMSETLEDLVGHGKEL